MSPAYKVQANEAIPSIKNTLSYLGIAPFRLVQKTKG
jgi:hypothetical protein